MLQTILLVLHVIVAIALIAFILLQQGRGATTGAAFGSGASSTVFGSRGSASFLSRTTSVLAIVFFSNCLLLAFLGGQNRAGPQSVLEQLANEPASAPASDAPPTPPVSAGTTSGADASAPANNAPTTTATAPATSTPAVSTPVAPAAQEEAADMPNIPPAKTSP